MNSIHNNGENDQSLNEGLDKLGHAYAQLPDEQPPELLDQAILNRAHRAVEKKAHWMQFGWLHGLTTAAVVVLAISLVYNQREQVPNFENEIRIDEPQRSRRENVDKKQSGMMQSDDSPMELKEKQEYRQDASPVVPPAAAPQSEVMEINVGEQITELTANAERSVHAAKTRQTKADNTDKDMSGNEPALEEQLLEDSAQVSDVLEFEAVSKRSQPATAAAGFTAEADELTERNAEINQWLQEIILLKQSGDASWEIELESFKEKYPDYPLPKELSD